MRRKHRVGVSDTDGGSAPSRRALSREDEKLLAHILVKEQDFNDSEVFRGLAEEHAGFESRLDELTSKHLPTEQERIEETQIKKHKLILKDQMATLIRDYREKLLVAH